MGLGGLCNLEIFTESTITVALLTLLLVMPEAWGLLCCRGRGAALACTTRDKPIMAASSAQLRHPRATGLLDIIDAVACRQERVKLPDV